MSTPPESKPPNPPDSPASESHAPESDLLDTSELRGQYEQMEKESAGEAAPDPNCPRCNSTRLLSQHTTFSSVEGVLVYCSECGAILGWGAQ